MTKKNFFPIVFMILFVGGMVFQQPLSAQLVLGQYEDEAPFGTWNIYGIPTAAGMALGNSFYTYAHDASSGLKNPALLCQIPSYIFTLNYSFNSASFYKFGFINTGVIRLEEAYSMGLYATDFAGLAMRFGSWSAGLSYGNLEYFDRPAVKAEATYQGTTYYTLDYDQSGGLKNLNFTLARKISGGLSAGVGINYIFGNYSRNQTDNWLTDGITITDKKEMELSGFCINGGLYADISTKLAAAAVVRLPYTREAESWSFVEYVSTTTNTTITHDNSAKSKFKQPLLAGLGLLYRISSKVRLMGDISWINWENYSVDYFEEEKFRNFKNIIKGGIGAEYTGEISLFKKRFVLPIRFGIDIDPQPMRDPDSAYTNFCFGLGLHLDKYKVDVGGSFGREEGSGDKLKAGKVVLTVSYFVEERKNRR